MVLRLLATLVTLLCSQSKMRQGANYSQLFGPADMKQPRTKDVGLRALYQHMECDSFTCYHCQKVVFVPPRCDPADLGGLCKICMKPICSMCVGKGCTPWEKQMDIMERRQRLYDSIHQ